MEYMKTHLVRNLLQLASPRVGSEVRKLIRDLSRLGGIRRVAPVGKIPRLLWVNYDPRVIQGNTLIKYVRRSWAAARLV
jgi:hypothetical protein